MELIIKNAFVQVLQDTLGVVPLCVEAMLLEGYLASIDLLFEDGKRDTIAFVSSKEFLEVLGMGLFGESVASELELRDLSQELANLTIGLAKVLAVKEGIRFQIATPQTFGFCAWEASHCSCVSFALDGALCSVFLET